MNEIGKTSGFGFNSVGQKGALETGAGFNMNEIFTPNAEMTQSIDKKLTEIVNTKFANFDSASSSLFALAVIHTGNYNELWQKDSPLALANNLSQGINVVRNM